MKSILTITKKLHIKTIKNRFLVVMILLTIIPILFIGIISCQIAGGIIERNHISSQQSNLKLLSEVLDLRLKDLINMNRNILANKQFIDELNGYIKPEASATYFSPKSTQIFDRILSGFNLNSNYIDSICVLDKWGRLYFYGVYSGMTKYFQNRTGIDYKNNDWFKRTMDLNGKEQFFGYNVLVPEDKEVFSCTKLLRDPDNFNEIGMLIINIRTIIFEKIFINLKKVTTKGSSYLIIDEANKITILVPNNNSGDKVDKMINNKKVIGLKDFETKDLIISSEINATTGWEIVNLIERQILFRDTGLIKFTTFIMSMIVIVVILGLFMIFSNALNKPLKLLEKVIDDVGKGKRDITEEFGDDEIGKIGNQFKMMVNENLKLSERIINSNLKQKEAELKMLQAQINPHFFYNTLDSIYWLATMKKADDVAKMTIALSEFFKLTLNKGEEITTVRDEIKHIEYYLTIQNFRYKDRFKIDIQVDERLMEGKIVKLLLQPLVENAIYHGLEPKLGEGHIKIFGAIQDKLVVFIIEDDGVGMNCDTCMAIRSGYGIRNIQERIKLYYGAEYSLVFKSELNKGTKVIIKLPLEKIV